jgi:hypothetical protein
VNANHGSINWRGACQGVIRISWALLFLTLPVTSFPIFPGGLGGKTLVRPLAIYPLIVILILATLPRLLTKPLPRTFLPLFAFILLALASSIFAFRAEQQSLYEVTMLSRFLRNLVTLGIGSAFYLAIALLPENWKDLRFSLRWLFAGFGIALLWGSLQAIYVIQFNGKYFKLLNQLQSLVSTRKLFQTRISGLTYEPKWFAEQLVLLLLPWLLSAVLTKHSLFKWRYKWITVEWLLLVWASAILVFTFSRSGMILLGVLALTSFFLYRFEIPTRGITPLRLQLRKPRKLGRKIVETILLVCTLLLILAVVGSQSTYFSRFWTYFTEAKERRISYLEYIAVQQRLVYFETAFRMYQAYPLLGVGLGNYAFYFDEMLPDEPWFRQPEIIRHLTPAEGRDRLITPKNLPGRLLAETGLFGTIAFTTFVTAILGGILYLWFSSTREQRFWSLSGLLSMLVFAFVVFSFDSFALPNMWVFFGLMTAAAHLPDPSNAAQPSG